MRSLRPGRAAAVAARSSRRCHPSGALLSPSAAQLALRHHPTSGSATHVHPALALGTRARASVATLDEVLDAAKQESGASDDVVEEVETKTAAASSTATPRVKAEKGVLWFANIYPTKAFRFDFRQALTHHNHETLIPKLLPEGVEVLRMVPREREGGAYVYFRAPPSFVLQALLKLGRQQEDVNASLRFVRKGHEEVDILQKVCDGITAYLKSHEVRAFLCPQPVRAHRVVGQPYHEDLSGRYPSSRVRIRCEPSVGGVSEEQIYQKLRKYGQLEDLTVLPEGKGFRAVFTYTAAAVAARNCLHRSSLTPSEGDGAAAARLHFEYEQFMQKWLRDQIVSNARYSLALFVFCMLGTTYIIWDPLRTLSVETLLSGATLGTYADHFQLDFKCQEHRESPQGHERVQLGGPRGWLLQLLSGSWLPAGWVPYTSAMVRGLHRLQKAADTGFLEDFWIGRLEEKEELEHWLTQPQDKLMLLTGYRGNGQEAVVAQLLGGRAVFIDVGEMLEAGSADDQIFLRKLCRAVGYWPAQGMDRQMTALLDLMLPGSGKLSRENELVIAVQRILYTVTQALIDFRSCQKLSQGDGEKKNPVAPLFVVTGFSAENKDRREGFFASLVTWGAYVSEAGLARVLFIADSSFAEPAMLGVLNDRPERVDVQQLQDANLQSVRHMLRRQIGEQKASALTDQELATVGGRFRDIGSLISRIHSGCDPKHAVAQLVQAAETTVRTFLMVGQPGASWTRPQLWRAVRLLAQAEGGGGQAAAVPYDVFLYKVFRGDEVALRSMRGSGLISVVPDQSSTGSGARRYLVKPGSPLFAEVYRRLVQHRGLSAVFDLEVAKEDIKREQATVNGYETELVRLQEVDDVRHDKGRDLFDPNLALRARKVQLLSLIAEQHKKLEKHHKERREAQAAIALRSEEASQRQPPDGAPATADRPSLTARLVSVLMPWRWWGLLTA